MHRTEEKEEKGEERNKRPERVKWVRGSNAYHVFHIAVNLRPGSITLAGTSRDAAVCCLTSQEFPLWASFQSLVTCFVLIP